MMSLYDHNLDYLIFYIIEVNILVLESGNVPCVSHKLMMLFFLFLFISEIYPGPLYPFCI